MIPGLRVPGHFEHEGTRQLCSETCLRPYSPSRRSNPRSSSQPKSYFRRALSNCCCRSPRRPERPKQTRRRRRARSALTHLGSRSRSRPVRTTIDVLAHASSIRVNWSVNRPSNARGSCHLPPGALPRFCKTAFLPPLDSLPPLVTTAVFLRVSHAPGSTSARTSICGGPDGTFTIARGTASVDAVRERVSPSDELRKLERRGTRRLRVPPGHKTTRARLRPPTIRRQFFRNRIPPASFILQVGMTHLLQP